jgi:hypothetical protein
VVKDADKLRRWPRRSIQFGLGMCVAALVIAGVIAVGNAARDSIGRPDRYQFAFSDIECPAPPGMDHRKFLDEVQYNGQFDDQVSVLDPTLPDRVRAAFERHPRVEKVGKVQVLPPKRVVVELTFKP